MKITDNPNIFSVVWANAAGDSTLLTPIPTDSTESGRASLNQGFPIETFTPISAGGVPPDGKDMNGVLNMATRVLQAYESGQLKNFDPSWGKVIGGYPKGAVVLDPNSPQGILVSQKDDNMGDPTDPLSWLDVTSEVTEDLQKEITRATNVEQNLGNQIVSLNSNLSGKINATNDNLNRLGSLVNILLSRPQPQTWTSNAGTNGSWCFTPTPFSSTISAFIRAPIWAGASGSDRVTKATSYGNPTNTGFTFYIDTIDRDGSVVGPGNNDYGWNTAFGTFNDGRFNREMMAKYPAFVAEIGDDLGGSFHIFKGIWHTHSLEKDLLVGKKLIHLPQGAVEMYDGHGLFIHEGKLKRRNDAVDLFAQYHQARASFLAKKRESK